MFLIIEKIDKALESKVKCTLVDKMGKYLHGVVSDSWVCISGGKLKGRLVFESEERGRVEMDPNDVLDLVLGKE